MRAHFGLPSVSSEDHMGVSANAKAPISVQFEIPYFTVSGIQVRYLKVRLRTHAPQAQALAQGPAGRDWKRGRGRRHVLSLLSLPLWHGISPATLFVLPPPLSFRSLRRAAIRRCRGCATSRRTETTKSECHNRTEHTALCRLRPSHTRTQFALHRLCPTLPSRSRRLTFSASRPLISSPVPSPAPPIRLSHHPPPLFFAYISDVSTSSSS